MKIYLAGPDVFREDSIEWGNYLKSICDKYGHIGLYPFDNEVNFNKPKKDQAKEIFTGNLKMIKECDVVLANLVPFRGPSADVGTVWEVAYAMALGKQVIGYRDFYKSGYPSVYKHRVEVDEFHIEDFDLGDNLMIDVSLNNKIYKSFLDAIRGIKL